MKRALRTALAAAAIGLCAAAPTAGQAPEWDARRAQMTRPELEQLRERLELAANSSAYSEILRSRARYEASLVDQRLRDGDFQIGDRVILRVQGEEPLSDTFTVRAGPALDLPIVGEIPLAGVLRSELEVHLRTQLSRFIRDPVVNARSLMRVAVVGEVNSPGFHLVAPETPLADLFSAAGGATRDANLRGIVIERDERVIWSGEALQAALSEGRTLDQLSLRAGDSVELPGRPSSSFFRNLALTIPPLLSVVIAAIQLF